MNGVRLFRNDKGHFLDTTEKAGISSSELTYALGGGVADIDGDGFMEILYPSWDGKMHCLNLTQHNCPGHWHFSVTATAPSGMEMATEPTIVDLDNDGKAEIIFGSWSKLNSLKPGRLFVLDYLGNVLHVMNFPYTVNTEGFDGPQSAGSIGNIDSSPDLEIVFLTAHSQMVAFNLPGSSAARVLWGTARGHIGRTGSPYIWQAGAPRPPLSGLAALDDFPERSYPTHVNSVTAGGTQGMGGLPMGVWILIGAVALVLLVGITLTVVVVKKRQNDMLIERF